MPKIPDKYYRDFSGGVRRDKSPFDLKDNELQRGRNFEIDEQGRIRKRRGSYQFGNAIAGSPLNIHHDPNGFLVTNNAAGPAVVYKLISGVLLTALTTSSTQVDTNTSAFSTSGTVEIEGDIITYTGESGNNLTGATGITSAHAVGASVNQWQSIGTLTDSDANDGAWFGYLNLITFILFNSDGTGAANFWQYDGTTPTAVSGEPAGAKYLEVFRDRIYMVGNGASGGNPDTRVFFSNLGDGTSWPATVADNSFDLEDVTGEPITGIKQYRGNLMIFKPSSSYAYRGSLPVRQISSQFGIHNDKCVQEINGLLYGFGPRGVFVTNGVSVQDIGTPVVEYYQDFSFGRIASDSTVQALYTAQWENKFIIYIGDTTTVDTISDVMLVYDTMQKSWEVWSGWTDLTFMKQLGRFNTDGRTQQRNTLFFGNSQKVFRAFENRHTEVATGGGLGSTRGTDVFSDLVTDTGSAIEFEVLTKPFDLGTPNYRKQFSSGYLKVFCERPQGVQISIVVDNKDPIPLGKVQRTIERFQFPNNISGNRCALLLNESSQSAFPIINGFVFEDITLLDKNVTR